MKNKTKTYRIARKSKTPKLPVINKNRKVLTDKILALEPLNIGYTMLACAIFGGRVSAVITN